MNIIFMGTPDFAIPSLETLLDSDHKISAVVTVPDKPKGRGLKLSESPVKVFALKHGLKLLQPVKLKEDSFINEINSMKPDLIVVVAFKILPKEVYSIPKYGSINLHSSLLPKHRGAAPINWVIINGDTETGVTTFFLQDKVDVGNIIEQNKFPIEPYDNAGSLHDKLALLGAETVLSTVDLIEESNGKVPVFEQDESNASGAPKIFKEDCKIDWSKTAVEIHNLVRGLSPYPGAFTLLDGKVFKIFKTEVSENHSSKPGSVSVVEKKIYVSTGRGVLEILELQIEGKRRMTASEFLKGNKINSSFQS
jgi:methionyl-tRNA formyltransferase